MALQNRARAWVVLLAASLLTSAASCSSPSQDDPRCDAVNPMVGPIGDDTPLVDERVVEWDQYEVLGDNCLLIRFKPRGDDFIFQRHRLEEDSDRIIITVIEGRMPDAPATSKAQGNGTLIIKTREPIGQRTVTPKR